MLPGGLRCGKEKREFKVIYHSISEGMPKAYPNSEADAEIVLDKSANSGIMTSNKREEDDDDRRKESGGLGTKTTGERLRSGESHEGMA